MQPPTHIFSLWWVPFACKYWGYQDEPTPLGKAKFNTHKTHFPLSPNLCHVSSKSPMFGYEKISKKDEKRQKGLKGVISFSDAVLLHHKEAR